MLKGLHGSPKPLITPVILRRKEQAVSPATLLEWVQRGTDGVGVTEGRSLPSAPRVIPAFQQLRPSLDKEKPERQQADKAQSSMTPSFRDCRERGSENQLCVSSGVIQNLPILELFL